MAKRGVEDAFPGFKCLHLGCTFLAASLSTMKDHARSEHGGINRCEEAMLVYLGDNPTRKLPKFLRLEADMRLSVSESNAKALEVYKALLASLAPPVFPDEEERTHVKDVPEVVGYLFNAIAWNAFIDLERNGTLDLFFLDEKQEKVLMESSFGEAFTTAWENLKKKSEAVGPEFRALRPESTSLFSLSIDAVTEDRRKSQALVALLIHMSQADSAMNELLETLQKERKESDKPSGSAIRMYARANKTVISTALICTALLDSLYCGAESRRIAEVTMYVCYKRVVGRGVSKDCAASLASLERIGVDFLWIVALCVLSDLNDSILTERAQLPTDESFPQLLFNKLSYCCVRNILKATSKALNHSRGAPSCAPRVFLDRSSMSILVRGAVVKPFVYLRHVFDAAVKEVQQLIVSSLGMAAMADVMRLFATATKGFVMRDNFDSVSVSNVLTHCDNLEWIGNDKPPLENKDGIIKSVLAHLITRGKYMAEGNWDKAYCSRVIGNCDKLMGLFLLLLQISGGGPARGTDLIKLSVCNTTTAKRNLFYDSTSKCWFSALMNGKTQKTLAANNEPIVRFYSKEVSELLLIYVVLLRPLHLIMVLDEQIGPSQTKVIEAFRGSFFVLMGESAQVAWLRRAFNVAMVRMASGLPEVPDMHLSDFRHFQTIVIRDLTVELFMRAWRDVLKLVMENPSQVFEGLLESRASIGMLMAGATKYGLEQAGHSAITAAMSYGAGTLNGIVNSVSAHTFNNYKTASLVWHTVLEGGGSFEIAIQPAYERVPKSLSCNLSEFAGKHSTCAVQEHGQPTCVLATTMKVLGHANWRSSHQMELVTGLVQEPTSSFLGILPTGGGKTVAIVAPIVYRIIHFNAIEGLTVLFTPLRSLRDAQVVAINNNVYFVEPLIIKWADFRNSEHRMQYLQMPTAAPRVCLVVATPEAAGDPEFMQFVKTLISLGRLERFVVDEAHNFVTSANFRPSYARLMQALITMEQIPLTLLSATWPPQDARFAEVSTALLGPRSARIIRQPVMARQNISYTVVPCSTEEAFDLVIGLARENALSRGVDTSKVIVFVPNLRDLEDAAHHMEAQIALAGPTNVLSRFDVRRYYANLASDEKTKTVERLQASEGHIIIFSSSAFGEGNDFPDVSLVVQLRGTFDLISLVQQVGRGGRDGITEGRGVYLLEENARKPKNGHLSELDVWATSNVCRLTYLCQTFDGIKNQTCATLKLNTSCDVCGGAHNVICQWIATTRQDLRDTSKALKQASAMPASPCIAQATAATAAVAAPMMYARQMVEQEAPEDVMQRVHQLLDMIKNCLGCDGSLHHQAQQCPVAHGRCLNCGGSGHDAKTCDMTRNGVCFKCLLQHDFNKRCDSRLKLLLIRFRHGEEQPIKRYVENMTWDQRWRLLLKLLQTKRGHK